MWSVSAHKCPLNLGLCTPTKLSTKHHFDFIITIIVSIIFTIRMRCHKCIWWNRCRCNGAHWMQTVAALASHDERGEKLNPQSTKNAKKAKSQSFHLFNSVLIKHNCSFALHDTAWYSSKSRWERRKTVPAKAAKHKKCKKVKSQVFCWFSFNQASLQFCAAWN